MVFMPLVVVFLVSLLLTLKMTTAQVVETSNTSNSLSNDYLHSDDHTKQTTVDSFLVISFLLRQVPSTVIFRIIYFYVITELFFKWKINFQMQRLKGSSRPLPCFCLLPGRRLTKFARPKHRKIPNHQEE